MPHQAASLRAAPFPPSPSSVAPDSVAGAAEAMQRAAVQLRDTAMLRGDKEAAQVAEICLCLGQSVEDRERALLWDLAG